MNDKETRGKAQKIGGRIKQAAGILTGNERLESEGAADRAEGAVREGVGKVQRKVGEFIEDIGQSIKSNKTR